MAEFQHEHSGGEAAYKYCFYPTAQQAELLSRTFGSVRYVYNRALAERSRAWTQEHKLVTFADTCRMLTVWKNDPGTGWLYQVSNVALQQGLQHLQHACAGFWARRARYPGFKSKRKSRASATFTTSGFRYGNGQMSWSATSSTSGPWPASSQHGHRGRRGGRPVVMDADKPAAARARRERGESPAQIVKALSISRATVYRHLAG